MSTQHECPYCGEELRAQQSTDGTKLELQQRIVFLEAQLMEAVMSRPQCSDEAFTAYVKGSVADALAKERAAWTVAWEKREAEWRKKGEGASALGEKLSNAETASERAVEEWKKEALKKGSIENDPNYQSFLKMSRKGRQEGRFMAGPTSVALPLADPYGFVHG